MTDFPSLILKKKARVSMITFGGKQFWTAKKGEVFHFNFVVERNRDYCVVQGGLNFYVFPARCVRMNRCPKQALAKPTTN